MYKNYQVLVFPPYNKYYVSNFVNMALRWLRKTILNIKILNKSLYVKSKHVEV